MILLTVEHGLRADLVLTSVKRIARAHTGLERLTLRVGARELQLGPEWRCAPTTACLAALAEFGWVRQVENTPRPGGQHG